MGGLSFDAVFEESHDYELQVTDNPVESGVVVSDHAFMLPVHVSISAGVTDAPLADSGLGPYGSDSRSIKAMDLLTTLQRSAEPFDVQTGLKLYKNMICTNLKTSQDKDTSGALIFVADLREVIIVNTQTVKYKSKKVKTTANSSTSKGSKTITDKQATPRAGATARQASPIVDRSEVKGNDVTTKKSSALYKTGIGALL
jgi:hypothetical protein